MKASEMSIRPSIAVVEDDDSVREATVDFLRSHEFIAKGFVSPEEFLKSNRIRITSCLIADVQMPGMTGLALFGHLVAVGVQIPTILITAYPDEAVRTRALNAGVSSFLVKPFGGNDLLGSIQAAFKQYLVSPVGR